MKIAFFPRLLRLAVVMALVAGCSAHPDRDKLDRPENPFKTNRDGPGGPKAPQSDKALRLEADQLYRRANQQLLDGDNTGAIERYNQLIARYPFSDYSTQAELEKIYAQYRNYQPDEAVTGADRFLREHPRHPNADYVQYIKGLTDAGRDEAFTDFLPLDSTKKDVSNARRAYDDFALLLQRYPTSRYASDTRKRMVALRNRVADHELSVVKFYVKRGAYVAAAKRAENIIAEFPGAPATAEALVLLERSDRRIGLTDEADEIAKLIAANNEVFVAAAAKPERKSKKVPVVVASIPDAPAAQTPAQTDAPKPPKTMLQRFVSAFDFLDTSKPENTYTVVIPSGGSATPAAATPADSAGAAETKAAGSTAPAGNIHTLKATVDYGDDAAPPASTAAAGGLGTSSDSTKDTATAPPTPVAAAVDQPKQPGLLERFVNLFSFLDPNKRNGDNAGKSSPQTPTDIKVDNTGATVPATTPDK